MYACVGMDDNVSQYAYSVYHPARKQGVVLNIGTGYLTDSRLRVGLHHEPQAKERDYI